jgi:hypothetical protein
MIQKVGKQMGKDALLYTQKTNWKTYIHSCMHTCIHTYINTHAQIHTCISTHIHTYRGKKRRKKERKKTERQNSWDYHRYEAPENSQRERQQDCTPHLCKHQVIPHDPQICLERGLKV